MSSIPDDRESLQARRSRHADRRGRPELRARDRRPRARQRLQGAGRQHRRGRARARARNIGPTAVSLDVFLPDMLGWTVLSQLKRDPATRHIPVQIVTLDEDRQHGLARGAFAYVGKPTTPDGLNVALSRIKAFAAPRRKRLLVVDDNPDELSSITALLAHDDIDITTARHRHGGADRAARAAVRLRGARPAAARHVGLRGAGGDPRRGRAARPAGRRVHRQGAHRRGGRAPAHARAQRRRQGRGVAGPPARRDGAVPASRGGRPAREQAQARSSGCTAPTRT